MHTFLLLSFVIRMVVVSSFSVKGNRIFAPFQASDSQNYVTVTECITMETVGGHYHYISPGGGSVCGFYMVGDPDQNVEITFDRADVSCSSGGLMAIVDGWEARGDFFPGDWDYSKPSENRYQTYCGDNIPHVFRASQNVALIQMRIPWRGEGFKFTVRFTKNKNPCNAVSMAQTGEYGLRNHGREENCSFSLMSPQFVEVESINIGREAVTRDFPEMSMDGGVTNRCSDDRVEFLDGKGLDPSYLWREEAICGIDSKSTRSYFLPCPHSVVRLVSSGRYNNSVKFRFRPITKRELDLIGQVEC